MSLAGDDDDDEDYDPSKDETAPEYGSQPPAPTLAGVVHNAVRKRRVDEIWEAMKEGEQTKIVQGHLSATINHPGSNRKRRRAERKAQRVRTCFASMYIGPS